MNDGQNLFESETSSAKERSWQLAKTADAAIQSREIEPLLIVGIANAGDRRLAEYTPTHDWKLGGGEADKYGRLLTEELLPFIAATYRIRPGAANTGLGGSSLGGLAALYLGLKYENIFGKLAVLSPSVWWNHRAILSLVSEAAPKLRAKPRLWLDVGDAEGQRAVADVDLLDRRLRAKGWRPGADLHYERVPGGTHDEPAWSQRVRPMLRFLFPA
jgi:enterochelin esterase-like enzyme